MRRFGLIGYPLGHSFSAAYFAGKFATEGISGCSYENFQVREISGIRELISSNRDLCGLNVTIPHKRSIIEYLDYIDPVAAKIGSVNVLKISSAGRDIFISGYNSDVTGIRSSLEELCRGGMPGKALILGSGGSSGAVGYTLSELGIDFLVVSRNPVSGQISYSDITPQLLDDHKLIINTTPLGMFPDVDTMPPVNYAGLSGKHFLFDLVYNPERTLFLRKGEERGCTVLNGLKMLHVQAERSWEIWNDPSLR